MKNTDIPTNEEVDLLKLGKELVDGKLRLAMQILARKSDESVESVVGKVKQERAEAFKECL